MAEHTPGPWVLDKTRDIYQIDGADGHWVCDCRRIDAPLIAQAPAMLEALRMGVQLAESGGHGEGKSCPTCHFLREARAAIAAAAGEGGEGNKA